MNLFDFTAIHKRENNPESLSYLKENRDRISAQCRKVLELLQSGISLCVRDAIVVYGISSLPRRILDLKQSGYDIKDSWVKDAEGKRLYKVYYIGGQE